MSGGVAIRAVIRGRVQGVWYRAWTRAEAEERGLAGWVRNRADGSVEALFAGEEAVVRGMLDACREGPPAAQVSDIATEPAELPSGRDFRIRR